jgi:hypothetical protein
LYYPAKCPSCNIDNIELIPISETEAYGINMDRGGVSMEFWSVEA